MRNSTIWAIIIVCFVLGVAAVGAFVFIRAGLNDLMSNQDKGNTVVEGSVNEGNTNKGETLKKPSDIFKTANPSVVYIELYNSNNNPSACGSGFIIDPGGKIATNYHVIKGAYRATVTLNDRRTFDVTSILYFNEDRDVAIIKIDASNLQAVNFGDSDSIVDGQEVVVIGSPLGLENSITNGLISNKNRVIEGKNHIQTSAPVSPGNSGGVLMNYDCEVIGMIVASMTQGQNVNFAIPINEIKPYLKEDLNIKFGHPKNIGKHDAPPPVNASYSTYVNNRYGFSLQYPELFDCVKGACGEAGEAVYFNYGDIVMTVSGTNNIYGMKIRELYNSHLKNTKADITYQIISGNWFVISWKEDGMIYYTKVFAGDGSFNTLLIKYPERLYSDMYSITEYISNSFRPGDLAAAH